MRCTFAFSFAGGGGGGGRGDPCAGAPADEICVPGRIIPRMPFDPGPAVFISLSDPIFGRGPPGRMGLPPEIDPEPGREEMMETMGAMRNENCKNAFTTAGTVAGALVGLAVTGAALAAAPAGVVIAVGVGGFFAGAAIGGAFGYSAGGPAGAAGAAYVSGLAVPFGRVGFAAAFPGRAATALVAGIRGTSPAGIVSFATSLVGTAAGSSLGAALCNR